MDDPRAAPRRADHGLERGRAGWPPALNRAVRMRRPMSTGVARVSVIKSDGATNSQGNPQLKVEVRIRGPAIVELADGCGSWLKNGRLRMVSISSMNTMMRLAERDNRRERLSPAFSGDPRTRCENCSTSSSSSSRPIWMRNSRTHCSAARFCRCGQNRERAPQHPRAGVLLLHHQRGLSHPPGCDT